MEHRFSVGGVLNKTFEIYFRNLGVLVGIGLLAYLPLQLIQAAALSDGTGFDMVGLFMTMVSLGFTVLALFVMQGAIIHGVHENLNERPFVVGRSLNVALSRVGVIFGVSIVSTVLAALGLMVFLVPGIIILCALWLAVPAAVVERKGVGAALGRSRELTVGYRMRIFGLVVILWIISAILGLVLGGVITALSATGVSNSWWPAIVQAVVNAATASLGAVAISVSYYHIRMDSEGVDLTELASVFD